VREERRFGNTIFGPQLNHAVAADTGQPAVRLHRQGKDRATLREERRLAGTRLRPQFDLAVVAAAGQPLIG
jgi:hypothetical protein